MVSLSSGIPRPVALRSVALCRPDPASHSSWARLALIVAPSSWTPKQPPPPPQHHNNHVRSPPSGAPQCSELVDHWRQSQGTLPTPPRRPYHARSRVW